MFPFAAHLYGDLFLQIGMNHKKERQQSECLKISENGCPPKNVANMRAGDDLEGSPAHPSLEAELQVLSAPNVKPEKIKKVKILTKNEREKKCQPRVVSAEFLKEGPVDSKKPA